MQNPKNTHARITQPNIRKSEGKEKRERERGEREWKETHAKKAQETGRKRKEKVR